MSETYCFGELSKITIGSVVAGVLTADWSGYKRDAVPCEVLGDTIKKTRPSTLLDCGELTVTLQYAPASHAAIVTLAESGDTTTATIELFSDAVTALEKRTCASCFVTACSIKSIKNDSQVEAEVTIKLNALFSVVTGS